jgi:hypothetical protein
MVWANRQFQRNGLVGQWVTRGAGLPVRNASAPRPQSGRAVFFRVEHPKNKIVHGGFRQFL